MLAVIPKQVLPQSGTLWQFDPPAPDSATKIAPFSPNAMPRGLASFLAITSSVAA
jgi:hypothetical protein